MSVTETIRQIDALGPNGPYRSRRRTAINDVTGQPAVELTMVPTPYVSRTMAALRRASAPGPDRTAMLTAAGIAFRNDTVAGLTADEYQLLVARITGLSISEIRSAADKIAQRAGNALAWAQYGMPQGAVADRRDPAIRSGAGLWARRGGVFAVQASGNHPAVHGSWLEALALGYRVAVRPSRREPLTAHRLVSALLNAGFSPDQVVLLPTEYAGADEMLNGADLAMVYGGDDVVAKYAGLQVLPNGPGRSKFVITADADPSEYVDLIADSAARGGGTGCTNATAVFVDGDVSALASAVAERLAKLPSLPPEHPDAVLPVRPLSDAAAMAAYVTSAADGATCLLGGADLVADLGDGSAVMRPAIHLVGSAADPRTRIELPFPCLWFAPWSPGDGIEPLRDTLNLTIVGAAETLIDALIDEPSIRSIRVGPYPTYWSNPQMPHDGYLSSFLMAPKALIDSTYRSGHGLS